MLVCHGRVGLVRATVSVGRKFRHGTGRIRRFTRFLSVRDQSAGSSRNCNGFTGSAELHPRSLLARPGDNTHHAFSRGDTRHASRNTKRVIHPPSRSASEIAPKHSQHPLILSILLTFSLHTAATATLSVLASAAACYF